MYQNFIIPYLYEAQHVSGDTPPIIRSLKLHSQPLIFHTRKFVGRVVGGRCTIHEEKSNKMQQFQNFIVSYLYEAQRVSGDTPPIIRSLKLHSQPLVFYTWKVVARVDVGGQPNMTHGATNIKRLLFFRFNIFCAHRNVFCCTQKTRPFNIFGVISYCSIFGNKLNKSKFYSGRN
jgi:hypothetical protein